MSVDEFELLNFFGVEPARLDPEVPWPYNEFTYEVTRGELSLSFGLAPAYKDVRIRLKQNGLILYELDAAGVVDVRLRSEKGTDVLEINLAARDLLWVRLRPEIAVIHRVGE